MIDRNGYLDARSRNAMTFDPDAAARSVGQTFGRVHGHADRDHDRPQQGDERAGWSAS